MEKTRFLFNEMMINARPPKVKDARTAPGTAIWRSLRIRRHQGRRGRYAKNSLPPISGSDDLLYIQYFIGIYLDLGIRESKKFRGHRSRRTPAKSNDYDLAFVK